jgi:hypothetical protein
MPAVAQHLQPYQQLVTSLMGLVVASGWRSPTPTLLLRTRHATAAAFLLLLLSCPPNPWHWWYPRAAVRQACDVERSHLMPWMSDQVPSPPWGSSSVHIRTHVWDTQ